MRLLAGTVAALLAGCAGAPAGLPAPDAAPQAWQSEPSVDDAGDSPRGPWSDLTAAWFAMEAGELVVRWTVASLETPGDIETSPQGAGCWNLDFLVNGLTWVLYARPDDSGRPIAVLRNSRFALQPDRIVDEGTHVVSNAQIPIEVAYGTPATLTVRYDAGAFPLQAGDRVRFSANAYSCFGDGGDPVDRISPGPESAFPADTWRRPPSGNVYRGGPAVPGHDPCVQGGQAPGHLCLEVKEADRGAAYVFTASPASPYSDSPLGPPAALTFYDEDGTFLVYGDPGGIPVRATRFAVTPLHPLAQWELRVEAPAP